MHRKHLHVWLYTYSNCISVWITFATSPLRIGNNCCMDNKNNVIAMLRFRLWYVCVCVWFRWLFSSINDENLYYHMFHTHTLVKRKTVPCAICLASSNTHTHTHTHTHNIIIIVIFSLLIFAFRLSVTSPAHRSLAQQSRNLQNTVFRMHKSNISLLKPLSVSQKKNVLHMNAYIIMIETLTVQDRIIWSIHTHDINIIHKRRKLHSCCATQTHRPTHWHIQTLLQIALS